MHEMAIPADPAAVPLWLGVQGLTRLWDRRAAEIAESAAAEAYQRAAAEALEVLRALSATGSSRSRPDFTEQEELPL